MKKKTIESSQGRGVYSSNVRGLHVKCVPREIVPIENNVNMNLKIHTALRALGDSPLQRSVGQY